MSGVYIQGIEMPKTVTTLVVFPNGYVACYDVKDNFIAETKAIPVPSHGRLGDLDELESGLRLYAKYQDGYRQQGILGACETIKHAPTIIPASEKE